MFIRIIVFLFLLLESETHRRSIETDIITPTCPVYKTEAKYP